MDWSVETDVVGLLIELGGFGFDDVEGTPGDFGLATGGISASSGGAWGLEWGFGKAASTGGWGAILVVVPLSIDGGIGSVDVISGDFGAASIGFGVPTKEFAVFLHWIIWKGDFAVAASGFAGGIWGALVVEVKGDLVLWSGG